MYAELLDWKRTANGKTALLIEGARRVGKSTLVEQFVQQEYETYILVDFNKAPKHIKELFEELTDLNKNFLQLATTLSYCTQTT